MEQIGSQIVFVPFRVQCLPLKTNDITKYSSGKHSNGHNIHSCTFSITLNKVLSYCVYAFSCKKYYNVCTVESKERQHFFLVTQVLSHFLRDLSIGQKATRCYFVSIFQKQCVHRLCIKFHLLILHHFSKHNRRITKHLACQMVKTNNICTFVAHSYEVIYLKL